MASKSDILDVLLARHGKTFCSELGIRIERNEPAPLFQWLVASNLFSTQISFEHGAQAARDLFDEGLTTPEKMAESRWETRVGILNSAGYARMDEKYSSYLGEMSEQLIETYDGDLRNLREAAEQDPEEEIARLKAFEGISKSGASIFCREVQQVWDELHPFADDKALEAANALDLGEDARSLAKLVDREDFPRLVAALVRAGLENDIKDIRDAA
ncbi:hypothetical protein E5163_10490 [Marinicauda algicola]|uniref:Uncharacterized protein n=1 Tax=Marinicauda algicola TaxID=2029849 RepID=A0A4S2GYJ8_9PROT|nr:hypothetical protein [Marinicauda algicola]TGY88245.1 hypothetical protein E5163_10490 [Marinicauda algicola]